MKVKLITRYGGKEMITLETNKLQMIKNSIISFFDEYNDKMYRGSVTFEYEYEKTGNKDLGELEISRVSGIRLIVDVTKIVPLSMDNIKL